MNGAAMTFEIQTWEVVEFELLAVLSKRMTWSQGVARDIFCVNTQWKTEVRDAFYIEENFSFLSSFFLFHFLLLLFYFHLIY